MTFKWIKNPELKTEFFHTSNFCNLITVLMTSQYCHVLLDAGALPIYKLCDDCFVYIFASIFMEY